MKRTSLLSTTLLLGVTLWGSSALALNISLDPSDVGPIGAGDMISVDVVASDLDENEVVTAFDMAIAFDDALLTLTSTDYSTALGDPACDFLDDIGPCEFAEALFDGDNVEGPGFADPNLVSLLSLTDLLALQGPGWDGVLVTLMFTANAAADSTSFAFDWDGVGLNDVKCNNARDPSNLDYVCFDGAQVPEPGTLLLLSLGLLGVGAARRGRRFHA